MKKLWKVATLASVVLFSTGCATIVSESSYPVNIKSTPSGASFVIKNRAGEEVKKGNQAGVEKTVELDTSLDGWYLGGNLLFGGLLGYLVIDPLTGAMYKLPDEVTADLTSNEHTLNIISMDSLTATQKAKLQPINL